MASEKLKDIIINSTVYEGVQKLSVRDANEPTKRDLFLSESYIEDNTVGQVIKENGDIVLVPSDEYYATKKISIKVNVPGLVPSGTLPITDNGIKNVENYANVDVNVQPLLEKVNIAINKNGITNVVPTAGKDGISKVTITTNIPISSGVEEIATASIMDSLLVEANVGKYYKFTGTSDSKFINGNIYLVEEEEALLATISAGTYMFMESPTLPSVVLNPDVLGKMNTLTTDNIYGDLIAFNIIGAEPDVFIIIADDAEYAGAFIEYSDGNWVFHEDAGSYTATDTTKLRTIIIETDQTVPQEFYDWFMANTQEVASGETWLLNETFTSGGAENTFTTSFVSNGTTYTSLSYGSAPRDHINYDTTNVYFNGTWTDVAYRTITFETSPTGDLLTWLQANGTKQ